MASNIKQGAGRGNVFVKQSRLVARIAQSVRKSEEAD